MVCKAAGVLHDRTNLSLVPEVILVGLLDLHYSVDFSVDRTLLKEEKN